MIPRSSRAVQRTSDHEKEFRKEEIPGNHENTFNYMVLSHLHGSKRASEQKNEEYGEEQGRKTVDKSGNGNLIHVKVG